MMRLLGAVWPGAAGTSRREVDRFIGRCAGLDVHQASVKAWVGVPDGHGGRHSATATVGPPPPVGAGGLAGQPPGPGGGMESILPAAGLFCRVPGVDRRTAAVSLAEIGVDMTRF
jgi:hypothetical protein